MTIVKINNEKRVNGFSNFNELLNSYLKENSLEEKNVSKVPAVNIYETKDNFDIELAAPGLKKEDFKISVDKDVLKITAEIKNKIKVEGTNLNRQEFSYSSFTRSFNLPDLIDYSNIEATYEAGILNISIAKKEEAKFQSRDIAIN